MRRVIEDCLQLDANRLSREGWFNGYRTGTLRWPTGDSIGAEYENLYLNLKYEMSGRPHWQAIRIEHGPCLPGRHRYYFRCPQCDTRRYRLPLGEQGFLCRECYRLPYFLQQAGEDDKLFHRYHMLEARLADPMTRRGRGRLLHRLEAAEEAIDRRGMEKFGVRYAELLQAPPTCEDYGAP